MCISGKLWHGGHHIKGERWVGDAMNNRAYPRQASKARRSGAQRHPWFCTDWLRISAQNFPQLSFLWFSSSGWWPRLCPAAPHLVLPSSSERPLVWLDVWCEAFIWSLVIDSALCVLLNLLLRPISASYPPPHISLALYSATQTAIWLWTDFEKWMNEWKEGRKKEMDGKKKGERIIFQT